MKTLRITMRELNRKTFIRFKVVALIDSAVALTL